MSKKVSRRKSVTSKDLKNQTSGKARRNNADEDFKIPLEAKIQILGFLIFIVGVMVMISVLSYNEKDQSQIARLNFFELFRTETYSGKLEITNLLGITGAITSNFFVTYFFGYFSVMITLLLITTGFLMMIKKPLGKMIHISVFSLILMLFLGTTFGLTKIFFSTPASFSGNTGDFIATVLYQTTGTVGASFIALAGVFLSSLFLIDLNIFKTLSKIKHFFVTLFEKIKSLIPEKEKGVEIIEKDTDDGLTDRQRELLEREAATESGNGVGVPPVDAIKQTQINRPHEDALLNAQGDNEIAVEKTITGAGKKSKPNELEVNPENQNELNLLGNADEDDFEEETLPDYQFPGLDLLQNPTKEEFETISDEELTQNGRQLQEKLLKFGIEIENVTATPGPVVTLYELIPAPDVKLSKIESLQDDIALAMKAKGIRMIIPIPGKGTVGVEIPNSKSQIVRIKSILSSQKFETTSMALPVAFGKMIDGQVYIDDLAKMPHVLVAGATGAGKSVGINTIISSLLYKKHPSELKFVMIDPKKIELSIYTKLRKHFLASSSDINESIVTSPSNAVSILKSVEVEMESRYDKLANAGVRNIEAYNVKYKQGLIRTTGSIKHRNMPYIVVIIDELADLMITAKREIEEPIARIAQMARAVGIHLVVATQRPSVDVITGVIKANFPVRIAYQVASKIDSRTILDMGGADQLLRNGDMLFLSSASPKPIRIQNAYISMEECENVVEFIGEQEGFSRPYALPSVIQKGRGAGGGDSDERDEMFEDAVRLVLQLQACSTSTLQRRLKLGYARAARIVDQMEEAGIVGPNQGARGREILITEDEIDEYLY